MPIALVVRARPQRARLRGTDGIDDGGDP